MQNENCHVSSNLAKHERHSGKICERISRMQVCSRLAVPDFSVLRDLPVSSYWQSIHQIGPKIWNLPGLHVIAPVVEFAVIHRPEFAARVEVL